MSELTHFDEQGRSRMVDVSRKEDTVRVATAMGGVLMSPDTFRLVMDRKMSKGDVFEVARLAGIMGAKKASGLIPLCHPLNISSVEVHFHPDEEKSFIGIEATVKVTGKTGVEMEALTAVSAAGLTVYDMCKAVDKRMVITDIRLIEKSGGRSGHFRREEA
ncbi:MAG TPA: cyclic pyranopterin monophosphate synthase MoaC [Nitrospirota bacterium]